jgi:hypothetical protein
MAYKFKKALNHGAPNPIVARLSLQILEILKADVFKLADHEGSLQ